MSDYLRRQRQNRIMMTASALYGVPALMESPDETEPSDGNSSLDEALRALEELAGGGRNAAVFQRIVRRLTTSDGERLDEFLVMLHWVSRSLRLDGLLVKADSSRESDRGWTFKAAMKIVVQVCAKIAADKAAMAFNISDKSMKVYSDAAATIGLVTGMTGMLLLTKNPWLSKALIKVGVVAVLASVLCPVGVMLDPLMAVAFGVWALFIFAVIWKQA